MKLTFWRLQVILTLINLFLLVAMARSQDQSASFSYQYENVASNIGSFLITDKIAGGGVGGFLATGAVGTAFTLGNNALPYNQNVHDARLVLSSTSLTLLGIDFLDLIPEGHSMWWASPVYIQIINGIYRSTEMQGNQANYYLHEYLFKDTPGVLGACALEMLFYKPAKSKHSGDIALSPSIIPGEEYKLKATLTL